MTVKEAAENYRLENLYYNGYLGVTEDEYIQDCVMYSVLYKLAKSSDNEELHMAADSLCTDLIIKYDEPYSDYLNQNK